MPDDDLAVYDGFDLPLDTDEEDDPTPVDWRKVTADDNDTQWSALDGWVRWLVGRYALDHREIPPCWHRHGSLVEELSALRTAHALAFDPDQPANAPNDWHLALGNTRGRLRDFATRTNCRPGEHRPDQAQAWPDDPSHAQEFAVHIAADRATRYSAEDPSRADANPGDGDS